MPEAMNIQTFQLMLVNAFRAIGQRNPPRMRVPDGVQCECGPCHPDGVLGIVDAVWLTVEVVENRGILNRRPPQPAWAIHSIERGTDSAGAATTIRTLDGKFQSTEDAIKHIVETVLRARLQDYFMSIAAKGAQ